MGSFYVGFDYKKRKNGCFKIGETSGKTPAKRLSRIRQEETFQCLGYLTLENETKSERLFVESFVRMNLERKGYTQVKNDHFLYKIKEGEKYEQANEIARTALELAKKACEIAGIKNKEGEKTYKRG